jgi:hypothetical protein
VLLLLVALLFHRGALSRAARVGFAAALGGWLTWNVLTTLWSEQPLLSLAKSLAMVLTVAGFVSGGLEWVRSRSGAALWYLAPFTLVALIAGLPGHGSFVRNSAGIVLYQGLTANPNFLGADAAVGLTVALYAVYRARQEGAGVPRFLLAVAAVVVLSSLLWLSGSRAAMLALAPVVTVFVWHMLSRRALAVLAACLALAAGAAVLAPSKVVGSVPGPVANWVMKGRSDLLFSRHRAWARSYGKARLGGVVGAGFGVSAGRAGTFAIGRLAASGYTREKANAQLAMIEETGVVGLLAFVAVLVTIAASLARGVRNARGLRRAELSFVTALLMGLVVHSLFESWWTAPGSMGAVVFWSSVGVAAGLARGSRVDETDWTAEESGDAPA